MWEGDFDERLGEPLAGVGKLVGGWRAYKAPPIFGEIPFRYELQQTNDVSNKATLTKHRGECYLQKCISQIVDYAVFLRIWGVFRNKIVKNGKSGKYENPDPELFYRYISTYYLG